MTEQMSFEDLSYEFRQARKLHAIRPDFYAAAQELIERTRRAWEEAVMTGSDTMADGTRERLRQTERTLKQVAEARADTIARLHALPNVAFLTAEEQRFYYAVQEARSEFIKEVTEHEMA